MSGIKKLATEFTSISFKHYGRHLNVAAHVLARISEPKLCNIYVDVIPEDSIRDVVCNDVQYSIECQHSLQKMAGFRQYLHHRDRKSVV